MKPKPQRIISWFLLLGALIFSASVRYRLLAFPLDRDEGEYAYAGQLLLEGVPPYKFAYNMKLPGTYLAYAGLMAVFGQTTEGVHLGLMAVNLMTIVFLYALTRQLFDELTAGAAVVSYSILSTSISMFGMAAHATHFVSFFGLAGTIVLWRCMRFADWRLAFSSGLLFGLAFLMKQQGVFLIAFGESCHIARTISNRDSRWFDRVRDLVAFNVGAAIPYLMTCIWLLHAGVWKNFKFWTIDYAAQYVQYISWREGIDRGFKGTLGVIGGNYLLWLLAFLGLVTLLGQIVSHSIWFARLRKSEQTSTADSATRFNSSWFVCGYLVFSAFCVVPSFIFRQHYFVVIQPALAILAGVGSRIFDIHGDKLSLKYWRNRSRPLAAAIRQPNKPAQDESLREKLEPSIKHVAETVIRSAPTVDCWYRSLIVLALTVVPTILLQADYFFLSPPLKICRQLYGTNPFPESQAIADYLREHTQPTDTIAVLGSEPQLYFLSQRRSATGYIYTYPIMEPQPFAHRMHEEMIHEIEQAAPVYLVDVQVIYSWMEQNNGEKLVFEWKQQYLQRHYERVGVVCISSGKRSLFRWGQDALSPIPKADGYVVVYRRIS